MKNRGFRKVAALLLSVCMLIGTPGFPITAYTEGLDSGDGDAAIVAADKAALAIGFSVTDSMYGVTADLTLPVTGMSGSAIAWQSDTLDVIANDGTIARPEADAEDVEVTLTATITYGKAEDTKAFTVTVLKEGALGALFGTLSVTWEGDGSTGRPYEVSSLEHLEDIPNQGLDQHYIQTASDIDLTGIDWTPIGDSGTPFIGSYDGDGNTISNLTINDGTLDYVGLFGVVGSSGTLTDIALADVNIRSTKDGAGTGALAGSNGGTVSGCSSSGEVSGGNNDARVGGLIGYCGGNVSNSHSTSTVTGGDNARAGGFAGYSYAIIADSYSTGDVTGGAGASTYIGGFVGEIDDATITNGYSTGIAAGGSGATIGGLIGMDYTSDHSLGSIAITNGADKTNYTVGETLDITGLVVTGTYSGSNTAVLPITTAHISGFNSSAPAMGQALTVTFGGKTTTYTVDVTLGWEGEGTLEIPFKVSSAAHLADISTKSMSAHYIQTVDINLSGYDNWTPIGGNSTAFTGTYNGGGHTISGLKITNGPKYSALFYWLGASGKLMNIGMEGAQVTASTATTSYAGSLVSWNDGTVTACYAKNPAIRITQMYSFVGGLVGCNNRTVSDSYSLGGSVSTDTYTHLGGLIGKNEVNKTVSNCYSTTDVTSSGGSRGGLIGSGGSALTNCYYDKNAAGMEGGTGTPKTTADMKKLSTFSGWDFRDTWKLHEDGAYPRLQWETGWTEDEEINAARVVLDWNLIRGTNSAQNNITADLTLPAAGKRSTVLSWAALPEGHIDTDTGAITFPSFDDGDQNVTLTATVSKSPGTPLTKSFAVTIKAYSADTDIEQDWAALTWDSIRGENSAQDSVTLNLATLPTAGATGTAISWTASPPGQSWIDLSSGAVTQPTLMQGAQTVTLTATVSKSPGTPRNKAFTLTLVPPSAVWIGNGTEELPYLVSSPDHLFSVRHFLKQNVYFKQTTDIDLTDMEYNDSWSPIGTFNDPFTGHYDGDGHKVMGLRISAPAANQVGLFGFISGGGSVKKLHLTDAAVTGGVNVGLLAGIIADDGGGTLHGCSAAGTVSGSARVGGLIGAVQHESAVVNACFSTATAAADPANSAQNGSAGGLVGFLLSGLVHDSYAAGGVTGGGFTGGFAGEIQGGTVTRCYVSGTVSGTTARGFTGGKSGGTVNACFYSTGTGLSDPAATGKSAAEMKRRPTFAAWDFADVWKIGDDASTPTLQWQPWTADEEITAAKYALVWDGIKGENGGADSVTSDLILPATGEKGVAVTWSVPAEQAWLTAAGAVTRPAFTEADETVSLTALFNKTGGAEQSKAFAVTVKKLDTPNAEESVTLDHAALTWDVIKEENASQDAVTGGLLLPAAGANGTAIAWSASPEGILDVSTGAVTLPAYDEEAAEVTLTATISKTGAASRTRSFVLMVKPEAAGDQQAVDDTFDWLTWARIKKDNDFENNIKTDLNLAQTGLYGAAISWGNDWGGRINPTTGAVTRPPWTQSDAVVTNTATISKGGVTRQKQFVLTVKAEEPTDHQAVGRVMDGLTWDAIKGGNDALNSVTVDLAALPTAGDYGVDLAWTTEPAAQGWVSIPSGAVTRPSPTDGDRAVTLTATVSKNAVTQTRSFSLTVKASPFARGNGTALHPYEVSGAAELNLLRSFLGAGHSGVHFLQTADIALSGNWTPIGDASNPFFGKYNGGGHLISGLSVNGSYNYAGLFGCTWGPAVLENILLTGASVRSTIAQTQRLGALCGSNYGTIRNCFAQATIYSTGIPSSVYAGVLVGHNAGTVERSHTAGSVSVETTSFGLPHAGGLAGQNTDAGLIRHCYSRATVWAGGPQASSGGLVGYTQGNIQNSYSMGSVSVNGYDHAVGGLVGRRSGGSISDSYYNSVTSGQSDTGKGAPKTTAEMKRQATFAGWDFAAYTGVWRMMEEHTYPILQWQDLTADEIITLDAGALGWDTFKGENSAKNNVTADLTLPSSGSNGAAITWEAHPAGCIDTGSGAVTRPYGADAIVTLTAKINRSGGEQQTKVFTLTVKLQPVAPTLDGPTALTLTEGYGGTSTGAYTITGTAPVTVTKTSGHASITWNDSTKKLDIVAGLTAGSYPVTLKAANVVLPDATLTFTLTVNALVNAQPPVITNNLTDKATYVGMPVTLDSAATAADGGSITYAWYSNTVRSTTGATALGVTTATCSPVVSLAGTTYYYCVVTNTNNAVNGAKTAITTSAIAEVKVNPAPATVSSVAVNPPAATIQKDTAYQFGATVTGTNNPSQGVVWSVSGQSDGGTSISPSGLLTVAAGETAETLTVTATSTADGSKSGTATVTVTDSPTPAPTVTSVTVTPATVTLNKSAGYTFSALVQGTNAPSQAVTWTVEGGNGATAIAADGTLTIYENETASTLTIKATSTVDSTKSGTAVVMVLQPPPAIYTLTITANTGGSITSGASGDYEAGTVISISASPDSGYQFSKWTTNSGGSFGSATSASTTFTVPASATTVTATFTTTGGGNNGGGSSAGGGDDGGFTPTIPPEKKPDQPVEIGVAITTATVSNGLASVTVSDQAITDAIKKVQEETKKLEKTANGIGVALDVKMPQGASSLSLSLSQNALQSLVDADVTSLTVNGGIASLGLDLETLKEIQGQSTGDVTISLQPVTNLSAAAKKLIGKRPVYDVTISFIKDGKPNPITLLGRGNVTLFLPYSPGRNEAVGWLFGVYVDDEGNVSRIPGSVFDVNSGSLILSTNHFSVYGVGYTAPTEKYTDIASHWAKESIDYVVGRGLFSGTTEKTFSPNMAMDRGMLVTVLGRLAGADVSAYKTSSFNDVAADKYYLPYVEWAYKNGIISGTGGGKFAPERAVTREEIALILQNYAKATGYKLPVTREVITFADASSIGSGYTAAVKAVQQAGIMRGENGNKFNSKASATRAELSAMLHRYIKLTIDPATAQGWTKNDDGRYMYYKDGKPLTGTQTIDGMQYFFRTDGTLRTGWVKDGNSWRYYSGNRMYTGWQDIGSKRYYFTEEGLIVSGKWLEIGGKWYYFYADGSLAVNTKVDGYEIGPDGARKAK